MGLTQSQDFVRDLFKCMYTYDVHLMCSHYSQLRDHLQYKQIFVYSPVITPVFRDMVKQSISTLLTNDTKFDILFNDLSHLADDFKYWYQIKTVVLGGSKKANQIECCELMNSFDDCTMHYTITPSKNVASMLYTNSEILMNDLYKYESMLYIDCLE